MTALAYRIPTQVEAKPVSDGPGGCAAPVAVPPADGRGPTVFVHIPKTAGSTVRTLLAQNYDLDRTYALDGRPVAVVRFVNLPIEIRASLELLHGHFPFGLHQYLAGPCRQFTFLRDPIRRYFSDFFYAIEDPRHNLHGRIKSGEMSILDYARLPETVPYFDNLMTQYLAGGVFRRPDDADLADAKRNLAESFVAFGITERFDESLLMIARALGWREPFYVTKNVSRSTVSDVPKEAIDAALPWLLKDQELYDFATELFAKRVGDLGSELACAKESLRRIEERLHQGYDADRHRFYYVRQGAPRELEYLRRDRSIGQDEARVRGFIAAPQSKPNKAASVPDPVVVTSTALPTVIRLALTDVPDLISVDIFDTVLLRTTKPEAQRFWDLSKEFLAVLDRDEFSQADVFIARLEAARAAYANVARVHRSREVSIGEIYRLMLDLLGMPADRSESLLEVELAYETGDLAANRPLTEALGRAARQGVRIVYASDMYLPAPAIDRLLTAAGVDVPFAAGYSSADSGVSKSSGELFDWIVERESVRPQKCLHLGDHPERDASRPRQHGWQSIHTPRSVIWRSVADARRRLFQTAMWQRGLTV